MRLTELHSDSARWSLAHVLCCLVLGALIAPPPSGAQGETASIAEARQAVDSGRFEEAEELLGVVVEQRPDSAQAWALLGRARAMSRRYRAAEPALRRAVELGETTVGTLLMLGSTLWENGEIDEAEEVLRQAVETGSEAMLAQHQLGSLLLWRGQYPDAIALLEIVVGARPGWVGAQLDLAAAYAGAGEAEKAQRYYQSYLERIPQDAGARYGLAMSLQAQGLGEAARSEMAIAAQIRHRERLALQQEGRIEAEIAQATFLLNQGDVAAAVERLESMPRSVRVLETLARGLQLQGDLAGAVARLEEAVALDPSRRDLRTRLQELYAEAGSRP